VEVKTLQETLNNAALQFHPALATDGIFGIKTLARVKDFQALAKIAMDGIVGPQTWSALMAILGHNFTPPEGPAVQFKRLSGIAELKKTLNTQVVLAPVEMSLISEYVFTWTSIAGAGKIHYFELEEKVIPKWYGVLVPQGVSSFDRVHLFFHPIPAQAGYQDSHYFQLGNWWKIWHYLSDWMGTQFCASGTRRIMIMPLMTTGAAQSCGVLPTRWRSIFAYLLGNVASQSEGSPSPIAVSNLVVSSFSSGISYSHFFMKKAGLGSKLAGVIDFDGSFSQERHYSQIVSHHMAGRVVRMLQLPTSTQNIPSAAAQNLFPLPYPRWKKFKRFHPWKIANAYQLHGTIPQTMMFTAEKRAK